MSNSLDPDQIRCLVGPDLGPNCLQCLSTDFANSLDPDQARHIVGPDLDQNCLQSLSTDFANSLDPDQARHIVGPDLGPNCLQSLSMDDKILPLAGKYLRDHHTRPKPSVCCIACKSFCFIVSLLVYLGRSRRLKQV